MGADLPVCQNVVFLVNAASEAEEYRRALAHLEQVIELEGPGTIAAVLPEPIPGTAGIMPPPPGYLAGVRELCDRYGTVFVVDEVMTGLDRTGARLVCDDEGVVADLLIFAKGVSSGCVPLGGVVMGERLAGQPLPGRAHLLGAPPWRVRRPSPRTRSWSATASSATPGGSGPR